MATSKRTSKPGKGGDVIDVAPVERNAGAPPVIDGPAEPEALDIVLEKLRAQFVDADLVIKVYREGERARLEYCTRYTLATVEDADDLEERIRDEWDGGDFRLMAHDGRGFVLNRRVCIAKRRAPSPGAAVPAATDAAARMAEETRAGFALIAQALQQPQQTRAQVLEELKAMKDLLPAPPKSEGAGVRDLLALFREGMQFARENMPEGGDANTNSVLTELVRTFGPTLAGATRAAQVTQQRRAAVAAGVPTGTGPSAVELAPPKATMPPAAGPAPTDAAMAPGAADLSPEDRALYALIKRAAVEGRDTETYADLLSDEIGDDQAEWIVGNRETAWSMLVAFDPEFGAHRVWVNRLFDSIAELYGIAAAPQAAGAAATAAANGAAGPAPGADAARVAAPRAS